MGIGFFPESTLRKSTQSIPTIQLCGLCKLNKACQSPNMPPTGNGKKKILVIGEAPGADEDEQNKQFVGAAGQTLRNIMDDYGIDLDEDCWKTNAVCCRPGDNKEPSDDQIIACLPNVLNTVKKYNPNLILLLGGSAVKSLIINGLNRQGDDSTIGIWAGWQIPSQRFNCWICPTYHPSYVNRSEKFPVVELIFRRQLQAALEKMGEKPWAQVPDYEKEVECIYRPSQAALAISDLTSKDGNYAFDYETNMLKPDSTKAKIVSCSISDGNRTIAFPWHEAVYEPMTKFLKSSFPKIAANLKFEERWTRKALGISVNNWLLDTVVAAHRLDNRPKICSVKTQAFLHLGQDKWNNHIESLLFMEGGNMENHINEIDIKDLLIYNGLDSLLEYKVGMIQMREIKRRNINEARIY